MFLRQPVISVLHNHLVTYPTPANLTYFWGFGSLAGLFFASQILTGVFLAMHYTPHVDLAFASVEHIMRDVNGGWFIRYLHANGASFFFFLVYCHIGRTLYFGFYTKARMHLWFSGILIFFLMMAIAFMGYVLPWGQMSFWGATVITNFFTAIPVIGNDVAAWLWGGFSVSNATLTRFFSFHYCLPFILLGVVLLHLVLLHIDGSLNPLGAPKYIDKVTFYPYFYVKDYFGFLLFSCVALFIISYYPDVLGHPDNYIEANALVTPAHIVPEWYFLPFYAILRAVPNKLGGVILMALAILILAVLPLYQVKQRSQFLPGRIAYSWAFWIFMFCVLFLGYLGGRPIESPYTGASQVLTLYYFSFFCFYIFLDYLMSDALYDLNKEKVMLSRTFKSVFAGYFAVGVFSVNFSKKKNVRNLYFASWVVSTMRSVLQTYDRTKSHYLNTLTSGLTRQYFALSNYRHPYHLVNASPWPMFVSFTLLAVTMGTVLYLHQVSLGSFTAALGFASFLFCLYCWFRDVIREGTFEGHHTLLVQRGLKAGMILFIISEVCFFATFFWGFFHSSLSPAVQIGGIWPPLGIEVFNPWEIPLLNTLILLTSGASVTWAHFAIRSRQVRYLDASQLQQSYSKNEYKALNEHYSVGHLRSYFLRTSQFLGANAPKSKQVLHTTCSLINSFLILGSSVVNAYRQGSKLGGFLVPDAAARAGSLNFTQQYTLASLFRRSRQDFLVALLVTIALGVVFTVIQYYEYKHSTFTISDSIYGSTFFLTTGFHGLHVLIGTLFLFVCFFRGLAYHFTVTHHVGLESAIWYWHFVDVVWLGLYVSIYHWGGSATI